MQGEYDGDLLAGRINKFDIYTIVRLSDVGPIALPCPPPPGQQCQVLQVWAGLLWLVSQELIGSHADRYGL